MLRFMFLFVAAIAAAQPPVITPGSVVNAANGIPQGLPNHGISQGGMFILQGSALGQCGTAVASSFPLQANMRGTSMQITVGGTTVNAIMVYVVACSGSGPDQLAGIVPSNTPTGTGTITVTYNGSTSASAPIVIVANTFGIFTIGQSGAGPGVFTDPNYRVITLTSAAHAGDQLFIWGTGLGAITANDAGAPPVSNVGAPVSVYVGGVKAAIGYQGRSGCCSGIDQILFTVPAGVTGCYVPVAVQTGNVVSNFVTISIASSGNVCSDPLGYSVADLQKAQAGADVTVGELSLFRIAATFSVPPFGAFQGNLDDGEGHFRRFPQGSLLADSGATLSSPSAGCIVNTAPYTDLFSAFFNFGGKRAVNQGLDAGGALNVTGAPGARQLVAVNSAQGGPPDYGYKIPNGGFFGGGIPGLPGVPPPTPNFLLPGAYSVDDGSGGAGVKPFKASITIPPDLITWTNQSSLASIPRSQDLTLTWTGGDAATVMAAVGTSANPTAGIAASFICAAPSTAGTLTVPAWVLGALPASGPDLATGVPVGALTLASGQVTRFQAGGIDAGFLDWAVLRLRNSVYK